jgi:hypothetical protein
VFSVGRRIESHLRDWIASDENLTGITIMKIRLELRAFKSFWDYNAVEPNFWRYVNAIVQADEQLALAEMRGCRL